MQETNDNKHINDKKKKTKKRNSKNNKIIRRIIIIFVISSCLSIFNALFVSKKKVYINNNEVEINKIKSTIQKTQKEYDDFKAKSDLFKKYNDIWKSKILDQYDLYLDINNKYFIDLYKKYDRIDAINDFNIKIQPQTIIKTNQFNKNVTTIHTKVILTFYTIHDNEIRLFLNYIIKNLNTFLIVENINIAKENIVDINLVKSVINGNFYSLLKTEIHFNIYFVKENIVIDENKEVKDAVIKNDTVGVETK